MFLDRGQNQMPFRLQINALRFAARGPAAQGRSLLRDLFGTTALPLLAALTPGKTLKSCSDTCQAQGDFFAAMNGGHPHCVASKKDGETSLMLYGNRNIFSR
jgi:hypothetical protein